jgi:MraZ protein
MSILNNPQHMAMMFAEAQILSFDAEGRVSIPSFLLSHANITDQITFVGRGATFELWEPESFLREHEQTRQYLLNAALTQPGGCHG